jgi:hypothetical protein
VGRGCQQGKRKVQAISDLWLDHYVGERELQDKGIDATTRLAVVISSMADRPKASAGVKSKRRSVVLRYL